MHHEIQTFAYEAQWGGGFGWVILQPDGLGLASSEKASATRGKAIDAAQRWLTRNGHAEATVEKAKPERLHVAAGRAFVARLKAAGFSQRSFARALRIHYTAVSDWATGVHPVSGYAAAYLDLFEATAALKKAP